MGRGRASDSQELHVVADDRWRDADLQLLERQVP
jgi:hypothetical protein